ncbi:MAG: lysophospholipid acyltransferase family protein [Desulfobacterales bacterium]
MFKKFFKTSMGLSQFFQLWFNVMLTRIMGISFLRAYLYFLGICFFSFRQKERKNIAVGISHVFQDRLWGPFLYWMHLKATCGVFEHYLEKLVLAHKPLSWTKGLLARRLKIQNVTHLERIALSGKGGILVTGHFGAVEYLPLALAMNGYKIAMICRFKTSRLKEALAQKAEEQDIMVIDANEPNVAFRALKAIKNGRILVTECDEFSAWRPDSSESVSVFGHSVPLDKTLDFFHRRAAVPVIMGLMRRDGDGFTLCIEPIADGEEKIQVGRVAWRTLEGYILRHPEQWYQWKDAVEDLEPYIDWRKINENHGSVPIPVGHPVPAPSFS